MKHFISTLCVVLVAMITGTVVAQTQRVYATATDGYLNVREEPRGDAFVVDVLFTGDSGAKYLGKQGNWYKIEHDGQVGYVVARYATLSATKPNVKPFKGKLYYVVVQSFESLEHAKAAAENMPDALLSPVYRAVDKDGKVKYRICTNCCSSLATAKECQRQIKELAGWESWIWTTEGFPQCAYRPESLYDGSISVAPLTPMN